MERYRNLLPATPWYREGGGTALAGLRFNPQSGPEPA
eukprot:COSAG02_NODE_55407_length_290_cov_1.874346_1_plen_36_part_10